MILHGATFRHQLLLFTDSVVRKSQGNLLLFQPTSSFEELCRIQSFSQLLATPDWPSQAVCPPSLSLRSLLMSSVSPLLSFLPFPFYFTLYCSSPNSAVDPRSNQNQPFFPLFRPLHFRLSLNSFPSSLHPSYPSHSVNVAVECFQSRFQALFDRNDCSFISPSAT